MTRPLIRHRTSIGITATWVPRFRGYSRRQSIAIPPPQYRQEDIALAAVHRRLRLATYLRRIGIATAIALLALGGLALWN